jgi:hypothetical protein
VHTVRLLGQLVFAEVGRHGAAPQGVQRSSDRKDVAAVIDRDCSRSDAKGIKAILRSVLTDSDRPEAWADMHHEERA